MKPANYAPVYAGLYPELAEIARKHGYAMAVHGSFARDADLICIPWTDEASEPQAVVDAITSEFVVRSVGEPSAREHGRIVYTLTVAAPGCFIDLSFTPRSALHPSPPPVSAPVGVVSDERIIELAVAHSNYREGADFEVISHRRLVEFARSILAEGNQ